MDLFKLGLRSILGITMPGAILVLIFLYALFSVIYVLDPKLIMLSWSKDQQFLILVILFLVSYVSGSLMRLNAADYVDRMSGKRNLDKCNNGSSNAPNEERFEVLRKQLFDSDEIPTLPEEFKNLSKEFAKWISSKEGFPYPVWQFTKFFLYHPLDVFKFFKSYQSYMGSGNGRSGKEFFNYCKMVIYYASRQLGDAVAEEVHFAESIVRFYAGTYFGLLISSCVLFA